MRYCRAGFTLVEVLVAIVLIDAGLLALVAASAVLVRQSADLQSRSSALRAAVNRIQLLGAGPCASTSGASIGGGIHEAWIVVLLPNHVRDVRDSVAVTTAGAMTSITLRTRLSC